MDELILGFIGAGNMNSAILNGVLSQGLVAPGQVWLSNRSEGKLTSFQKRGVHTTTDNRRVAEQASVIVLGVSPRCLGMCFPDWAV